VRNEFREAYAPGGVFEHINAPFEDCQVHEIRAEEYDNEPYDFCAFLVCAFEIPDAVTDVAVESTGDKSQKV
jgi:hypothetical protein